MSSDGTCPDRRLVTDPAFATNLFRGDAAAMLMSDEDRARSLASILAANPQPGAHQGDVFIFAIGSIMWNPFIEFTSRHPARATGFRRTLCLESTVGRGSAELPGMMFGLEPGGSTLGFALRIAADKVSHELSVLWRLEMIANSYAPRWVRLRLLDDHGEPPAPVHAIAFVINTAHPGYAGTLPFATLIDRVARARGSFGTCLDYVVKAHEALLAAGLCDQPLARVVAAAQAHLTD